MNDTIRQLRPEARADAQTERVGTLVSRVESAAKAAAVGRPHQMDDATQSLVLTLGASGTDLAKLIKLCALRHPPVVYVAEPAVTAWETRAPGAWQAARQWLEGHHITIRTL
jgi:hypothetical protein